MADFKIGDKVCVRHTKELKGKTYKVIFLQGPKAGIEEVYTFQRWIVPVNWLY